MLPTYIYLCQWACQPQQPGTQFNSYFFSLALELQMLYFNTGLLLIPVNSTIQQLQDLRRDISLNVAVLSIPTTLLRTPSLPPPSEGSNQLLSINILLEGFLFNVMAENLGKAVSSILSSPCIVKGDKLQRSSRKIRERESLKGLDDLGLFSFRKNK